MTTDRRRETRKGSPDRRTASVPVDFERRGVLEHTALGQDTFVDRAFKNQR